MPAGPPTKYKPEFVELAYEFCSKHGLDDVALSKILHIVPSTLYEWKKEYPKLSEAIKRGKDDYDTGTVEVSLRQRANGYYHPEEKIFCNNGEILTYETTKHYPPDPASMIFWLKNRHPDRWRDKQDMEHKFSDLDTLLDKIRDGSTGRQLPNNGGVRVHPDEQMEAAEFPLLDSGQKG